jgi:hypothetical protein
LNIPSHLDLPEYKTSSTTIRPDWSNYTWTIIAEFFDPSDAYTFEQQLICDNWENPLLLNEHYNLGKNQFRNIGPSPRKGTTLSAETKQKMSDAKKGKTHSAESKQKMSASKQNMSVETRQKISDAKKGKTHSAESKQKMSDAQKGKPGKPHSAETKQKISDRNKGRTLSAETRQKMSNLKKLSWIKRKTDVLRDTTI